MIPMVKLKMRGVYKTFLTLVAFLIFVVAAVGVISLFYNKVYEPDSDIEVNGTLSINYIDGKKVSVIDKETIKFSITNSGDAVSYYNIGFLKVRGSGTYRLSSEDKLIFEGELKSIDELTTNYISIDSKETKLYSLEIQNEDSSKELTCSLNIRTQEGKIVTFADTILNNNEPSDLAYTKVGDEISTEDEGLIKSYDDIGVSYYFRGNVQNNYVRFADLTWRIVRINGDGTVRLVLDGTTDTLASYYNSETVDYTYPNSAILEHLEGWESIYLSSYTNYLANTKFCNDITEEDYTYNSYTRIFTNKIPTLNCLGESYTSVIGTLTIDEVILAGANTLYSNTSYYLYNSDIDNTWYTMSGAKGGEGFINMFMVDSNGIIRTDINGNMFYNVRPVINLIKNTEVTGDGTINNPYKISESN